MSNDKLTCDKNVWTNKGFRSHECGRKAVRYRQLSDGSVIFRCGLHSRDKSVEWEEIKQ